MKVVPCLNMARFDRSRKKRLWGMGSASHLTFSFARLKWERAYDNNCFHVLLTRFYDPIPFPIEREPPEYLSQRFEGGL